MGQQESLAQRNHQDDIFRSTTVLLEQVYEVYNSPSGKLGEGSFGTVWKGKHVPTGEIRAVKRLDKMKLHSMRVPRGDVFREIDLMSKCCHKNICRVYDAFENQWRFDVVMEFCDGGDLQQKVQGTPAGSTSEDTVAQYMRQILEAIAYLHAATRNIAHCDIKPHNFMIRGEMLKLGDFGIAVQPIPGRLLQRKMGSPAFMAPELHLLPDRSAGYDHKVDVWAAGVCMVFLLSSQCPFIDSSNRLLRDEIISGNVPLWQDEKYFGLFRAAQMPQGPSQQARLLVRALLQPNVEKRLTASLAVQHPWFFAQETGSLIFPDGAEPLLSAIDFQESNVGADFPFSNKLKGMAHTSVSLAQDVAQEGFTMLQKFLSADLATSSTAVASNEPATIKMATDLHAKYKISPTPEDLGGGMFGCAYKAHQHGSGSPRAIITLHKRQLHAKSVNKADVLSEIALLQSCVHKNIVHIFDCFEDATHFHFALDYMGGGTMQHRLDRQTPSGIPFSEGTCALWMLQLLEALTYLHSHRQPLVHRNVKPRTCMFKGEMLKLTDFGLAVVMPQNKLLRDLVGSPAYMAPEAHVCRDVNKSGYDTKVDVWAAGVILCMLLTLQCPFVDARSGTLAWERLRCGDVPGITSGNKFIPWIRKSVGNRACEVVRMMLVPERILRAPASDVIMHPWFMEIA